MTEPTDGGIGADHPQMALPVHVAPSNEATEVGVEILSHDRVSD